MLEVEGCVVEFSFEIVVYQTVYLNLDVDMSVYLFVTFFDVITCDLLDGMLFDFNLRSKLRISRKIHLFCLIAPLRWNL